MAAHEDLGDVPCPFRPGSRCRSSRRHDPSAQLRAIGDERPCSVFGMTSAWRPMPERATEATTEWKAAGASVRDQRFGKFRVDGLLGRGGMAEAYLCRLE